MITAMCLKNKWNVFYKIIVTLPTTPYCLVATKTIWPSHLLDSLSTKRATKGALMCLQQYLLATNREVDLESYCSSEPQLSAMLVNFYADARKKNGEYFKLSALKSIRFGLVKHFSPEHGIDFIKDPTFKSANEVFHAVCVGLKRADLGKVDHTPPLEEHDLKHSYCSTTMSTKTPTGL